MRTNFQRIFFNLDFKALGTTRSMDDALWAVVQRAVPQHPPNQAHSVCRKLWDDGFRVMEKPFILAVVPLITLSLSFLFTIFLVGVLPYAIFPDCPLLL